MQLMEIAMKLKESHQYDLAVKLLKVHDPEVENDPEASYYVKMELMHILFLQVCIGPSIIILFYHFI